MTDEELAAIRAEIPWFDPAKHSAGTGGVVETATGTLLGEDGQPASAAVRALRADAEAIPAPAAPTTSTTSFATASPAAGVQE